MNTLPPPNMSPPPPCPPGYTVQWSHQYSRYFFINLATGQSQWEQPPLSSLPPSYQTAVYQQQPAQVVQQSSVLSTVSPGMALAGGALAGGVGVLALEELLGGGRRHHHLGIGGPDFGFGGHHHHGGLGFGGPGFGGPGGPGFGGGPGGGPEGFGGGPGGFGSRP
ncbi:hypothetical protein HK100_009738 [Physocladia obscura]|uniref:WW domain-containing protein n=1 Tax=Physocladia obscura TaxID=109957 RepID=A0AAD5XKF1_9FUNG|nr:hypothetical protein HK100_009738 [Physocladia obscura]